jgi:hypothetical protein
VHSVGICRCLALLGAHYLTRSWPDLNGHVRFNVSTNAKVDSIFYALDLFSELNLWIRR